MVLFPINTRELRSFRLLQRTESFAERLTTEDSSTLYVMCSSLNPQERVEMRGTFVHAQGLQLTFLPKNVSQNLLRSRAWKDLKGLFQGHVVEIRTKSGNALTEEQLRFIMDFGKFSTRLLVWRRQPYRAQRLREFLVEPSTRRIGPKLPASQLSQLLSSVTMVPFLVARGNVVQK